MGPHPSEPGVPITGATIRLRHFLTPLAEAGHRIDAVLLEDHPRANPLVPGAERSFAFDPPGLEDAATVYGKLGKPRYDAVIGLGSLMPAAVGARMGYLIGAPTWVDFNGDPLSEWEGDATVSGWPADHVRRDLIWKLQREALLKGDAFSAVSAEHANAVLGQLLLLGRVVGSEGLPGRIARIPNAVPDSWISPTALPAFPAALAERGLSPATPIAYYGGSWTSWMDADRMGAVLAALLRTAPDVHLVLRGGTEAGINGAVRARFDAALGAHPPGRVHQVPATDGAEDAYLAHAGAILLLDRDISESRLGTRNRLLPFVRWGTEPFVSVRCELSRDVSAAGIALDAGDAPAADVAARMAAAIASRTETRPALIAKGLEFLAGRTYAATTRALLDWAAAPTRWPDPQGDGLQPRWARRPATVEHLWN